MQRSSHERRGWRPSGCVLKVARDRLYVESGKPSLDVAA